MQRPDWDISPWPRAESARGQSAGEAGAAPRSLFGSLPDEYRQVVEQRAARYTFHRSEVLYHQGDPGDSLYVVEQGKVRVTLLGEEGGQVILATLGPGDVIGELSVFDGQPRAATVVADGEVTVWRLDRAALQDVLRRNPDLALHLLSVLSQRLRSSNEVVQGMAFLDVPGRVAHKLLELAAAQGQPVGEEQRLEVRLNQRELANMVASTRETVNKHLAHFARIGLISLHGRRVRIEDPEGLARRAR